MTIIKKNKTDTQENLQTFLWAILAEQFVIVIVVVFEAPVCCDVQLEVC